MTTESFPWTAQLSNFLQGRLLFLVESANTPFQAIAAHLDIAVSDQAGTLSQAVSISSSVLHLWKTNRGVPSTEYIVILPLYTEKRYIVDIRGSL